MDDGVMGGRSRGHFTRNASGYGQFQGTVSLANNGGFSLVRHRFPQRSLQGCERFVLHLRGDGKRYQFRVRASAADRHTYVCYFPTTGAWEEIAIPFDQLLANFRGRKLELPPFPGHHLAEIGFLIGNQRAESFQLELSTVGAI